MKIGAKLMIAITPLVAAGVLALCAAGYVKHRDQAVEGSFGQLFSMVEYMTGRLTYVRAGHATTAELLSNSQALKTVLASHASGEVDSQAREETLRLLSIFLRSFADSRSIHIFSAEGEEILRAPAGVTPLAGSPAFGNQPHSEIALSDSGRPRLVAVHPLRPREESVLPERPAAEIRGFIVIQSSLMVIAREIEASRPGGSGLLFLVNGRGRTLLHTFPGMVGETVGKETLEAVKLADKEGGIRSATCAGRDVYMFARRLEGGYYLGGCLNPSDILGESRRMAVWMSAIGGVTVVGVVLGIMLLLREVVIVRLGRLAGAASAVESGRTDTVIELGGNDEISRLGKSLQSMVRELVNSSERLRYIATHDELTGLPNRRLFVENLERYLALSMRHGGFLGVIFLDLSGLGPVNTLFGHAAGDRVLRVIGERVKESLRREDVVCRETETDAVMVSRVGGDEFLILLTSQGEPPSLDTVARRLISRVEEPIDVDVEVVRLSCCLGMTLCPADGTDPGVLLRNADMAMREAKQAGKGQYRHYSREMNERSRHNATMARRLEVALDEGLVTVYYQPVIDAATSEIVSLEALARWYDPEYGWVSPANFLSIAEESLLVGRLTSWVVHEACLEGARLRELVGRNLSISVNISSAMLLAGDVPELIHSAVSKAGLETASLIVEVEEAAVMKNSVRIGSVLHTLKEVGCSVALDSFGIGGASLSALARLPVDYLKLDRSLVPGAPEDKDSIPMLSAVLAVSQSLGLKVVAKGVQSWDVFELLRRKGCGYMQGHFYSPPVPVKQITHMMSFRRPKPEGKTDDAVYKG